MLKYGVCADTLFIFTLGQGGRRVRSVRREMLKVKNALRVLCEDAKERVVVPLYEIDIGLSSLGRLRMKKGRF